MTVKCTIFSILINSTTATNSIIILFNQVHENGKKREQVCAKMWAIDNITANRLIKQITNQQDHSLKNSPPVRQMHSLLHKLNVNVENIYRQHHMSRDSNRGCWQQKNCQTMSHVAKTVQLSDICPESSNGSRTYRNWRQRVPDIWCCDTECLGFKVDPCCQLIELTGGSQSTSWLMIDNEASHIDKP